MNYHFIAIGGAVMHNLALELQHNQHVITGSDDEIFEPAKSRLEKQGLLPEEFGWFPTKITKELEELKDSKSKEANEEYEKQNLAKENLISEVKKLN